MGFGLKRTFNKGKDLYKTYNPLGSGLIDALGNRPGPENPYDAPRPDQLAKPEDNPFLADLTKNISSGAGYTGFKAPKSFSEYYNPNTGRADTSFKEWLANINAPSSVDDVRKETEGERLQMLLAGIDEDTARAAANVKMDAMDRGLGGAGIASDIEFNALGTAQTGGVKAKSGARLDAMGLELDRLKAREDAARGAYGTRYDTEAGIAGQGALAEYGVAGQGALQDSKFSGEASMQDARIQSDLKQFQANLAQQGIELDTNQALEIQKILAGLYEQGADRRITGRRPGLLQKFGDSFMQKLGGNSADAGSAALF